MAGEDGSPPYLDHLGHGHFGVLGFHAAGPNEHFILRQYWGRDAKPRQKASVDGEAIGIDLKIRQVRNDFRNSGAFV